MDKSPINWVQLASVIFGILILYEQIRIIIERGDWKRVLNATLWGIHLLVFYAAIYLHGIGFIDVHDISNTFFTDWSPWVRLHSALAFYLIVRSNRTFMIINRKISEIVLKFTEKRETTNVE